MADRAISALTLATALGTEDLIPIEQSGTAKKLRGYTLKEFVQSTMIEKTIGITNIEVDSAYRLVITMNNGKKFTTDPVRGPQGPQGEKGDTGVGIQSISLYSTSGLNKTYRITFTDGRTYNFTVTNGAKGDKGDKGDTGAKGDKGDTGDTGAKGDKGDQGDRGYGITSISKVSSSGLTDTYRITYADGVTRDFTVTNGAKGDKGDKGDTGAKGDKGDKGDRGAGITGIDKVSSSGLADTYRITYADGATLTYVVTNGAKGDKGDTGDDGISPGVTVAAISGGHRVTITDAAHPSGQSFDVMNGTGAGDMVSNAYDRDGVVATAGGIKEYVEQELAKLVDANDTPY